MYKFSTRTNFRQVVVATYIKPEENLTAEILYRRKFNLRKFPDLRYIRAVFPPVFERMMERYLTVTTKAEAALLTFSMEVWRYLTSPLHSLLSSSPHGHGPSCSMTAMVNLFLALSCYPSPTRCCLSHGVHTCLYIWYPQIAQLKE